MPINKTYAAPITLGFVPDDGDLIRGTVNGAEVNGQWIGAEGYASLYLKGNTDVLLCNIGFYGEQAFVDVVQTSAPTTDYELHLYRYVPSSIVQIPQRYVDGLEETTANANQALENAATAQSTADTAKSTADTAQSTADTAKSTANALTCELIYQGTSWMQSNVTSGSWNFVSYSNGIWIAGSNSDKGLFYSTNGITWTQSNVVSDNYYFASYNNEIWVAGSKSSKGLFYSTDGKTWTQSDIKSGNYYFASYNNGIWVSGSIDDDIGIYHSINKYALTKDVEEMARSATVIPSSTSGSTKKFKITVDDTGTISATEVT